VAPSLQLFDGLRTEIRNHQLMSARTDDASCWAMRPSPTFLIGILLLEVPGEPGFSVALKARLNAPR